MTGMWRETIQNAGSRLVLGTAQLGMQYGIANLTGKPDPVLARQIVEAAWECGVREFDTAQAYGDSETVLGRALAELGVASQARIISKLDPGIDLQNGAAVHEAVAGSIRRLGVEKLYGLMIHNEMNMDALGDGLSAVFQSFVDDGIVDGVGVSVYSPDKALKALSYDVIGMFQVPANVFDRRMRDAGVFSVAQQQGKQVYLRSVFLQGVLLMDAGDLPEKVGGARGLVNALHSAARAHDVSRLRSALGYVRDTCVGAKVVFGAELPEHVRENCRSWRAGVPRPLLAELESAFPDVDERIIDPRQWTD